MKKRRKQPVWVVVHCEFMGLATAPHIDEMPFHVSSTLHRVERYLKSCYVAPYSWWKVQQYLLDGDPEDDERWTILYYTHTGRAVRSPPTKRALAAFRRRKDPLPE